MHKWPSYVFPKITLRFCLVCIGILWMGWGSAQEAVPVNNTEHTYGTHGLQQLIARLQAQAVDAQAAIKRYRNNQEGRIGSAMLPIQETSIQGIGVDGSPLVYEALTDATAQVTRADYIHSLGAHTGEMDGAKMSVGVWDAGHVRTTHREFGIRASILDADAQWDSHATMVAGILAGGGIKRKAKGVAPAAEVFSYDWSKDRLEVAQAAAQGMLLSNHSYGIKTDRVPDWYFGAYIKVAKDWDDIMYHAPHYLMVAAAGNAQQRRDNDAPLYGGPGEGYDVLLGFTLSKNNLTVAAADTHIDRQGGLEAASVSRYSSFGPVDDGRIKPDLAGNGATLVSASALADTSYDTSSGTSMATPGVTGTLLLLQQYYHTHYGRYLKAASLKGLALHTADDLGGDGPDYKMGWGILNAKKAVEAINAQGLYSSFRETRLAPGEVQVYHVDAKGDVPLGISISWTDPTDDYVNRAVLNDTTKALVNDLDIKVVNNGKTIFPWILDPAHPTNAAQRGNNRVDPFERIDIPNAQGGYTIYVSHKGSLKNNGQDFSLWITGIKETQCQLEAPATMEIQKMADSGIAMTTPSIPDARFEWQYKDIDSGKWSTLPDQGETAYLENLVEGATYMVRTRVFCALNLASEYSFEYGFVYQGEDTVTRPLGAWEPLEEKEGLKLQLYPNPAIDEVVIQTPLGESAGYMLVSAAGVPLRQGKAQGARIPVADLASGLYIVQVEEAGMRRSTKFYKQ